MIPHGEARAGTFAHAARLWHDASTIAAARLQTCGDGLAMRDRWRQTALAVLAVLAWIAATAAIVWTLVARYWGRSLLESTGSRNTPLWVAWFVLLVLLGVLTLLLPPILRTLRRALTGAERDRRAGSGPAGDTGAGRKKGTSRD